MVGNLQKFFMEHYLNIRMIFGIKEKIYNCDPYNILLAIATNIPERLKTAFVLQDHIYENERVTFIIYNTHVFVCVTF